MRGGPAHVLKALDWQNSIFAEMLNNHNEFTGNSVMAEVMLAILASLVLPICLALVWQLMHMIHTAHV